MKVAPAGSTPNPRHLIAGGILLLSLALACWWAGADLPLHRFLRLTGPMVPAMVTFSALGGLLFMGPLALLACGILLWRHRAADALWLFLTIGSGRLAVEGTKLLVLRPRPPRVDWSEIVTSWSFPSSHSAGTMMTCVALAWLSGGSPRATMLALLAAAAIGWSRVALAVHWPSDVLAGWGFGLVWIGLAAIVRARFTARPAVPVSRHG